MGVVLTGALISKKTGKVIAVGEWEALEHFLGEMKSLNPKEFNKRNFHIELGAVSRDIAMQASVLMQMGFGRTLRIYGCADSENKSDGEILKYEYDLIITMKAAAATMALPHLQKVENKDSERALERLRTPKFSLE